MLYNLEMSAVCSQLCSWRFSFKVKKWRWCLQRQRHSSYNNMLFTLTPGWKIGLMSTQQQSNLQCLPFTYTHAGADSAKAVFQVTKAVTIWCAVWPLELALDLWAIHECKFKANNSFKEVVTSLQGLKGNLAWWTDRRTVRQVTSDNVSDWCHGERATVAYVWTLPHLTISCNVSVGSGIVWWKQKS